MFKFYLLYSSIYISLKFVRSISFVSTQVLNVETKLEIKQTISPKTFILNQTLTNLENLFVLKLVNLIFKAINTQNVKENLV